MRTHLTTIVVVLGVTLLLLYLAPILLLPLLVYVFVRYRQIVKQRKQSNYTHLNLRKPREEECDQFYT